MPEIVFTSICGDEQHEVKLLQQEHGNTDWLIIIDGVKVDSITPRMNEYYYHGNQFEVDDLQAIVDRITEFTGEPFKQIQFYRWQTKEEYWAQFKRSY